MSNTQSKSPTKRKSAKTSPHRSVSAKMSAPPSIGAKLPKSASWQEEAQNIWRTITALQYGKVGWAFGLLVIGGMFTYMVAEIRTLRAQNAVLMTQVEQLQENDAKAERRDAEAQRRDMEMMHILLDFSSRLPPPGQQGQ